MKSKLVFINLLMFISVLGTLTISNRTASASSWHKGTPAALQGKYKSHPSGAYHRYARMYIRPHSAPFYSFQIIDGTSLGSPMMGIAMSASYKKINSHYYQIKGIDKTGTVNQMMRLYKQGSKIKFTFTHSFKGQPWLYKYK